MTSRMGRRGHSPVMKHRPESLRNSGSKQRMNHKLPAKRSGALLVIHVGGKKCGAGKGGGQEGRAYQ
jgi:hypothetical protein